MAGRNSATPIQGVLERVVAEAATAAVELEARKEALAEQLKAVNDELRTLNRVVSAAQPSEAKPRTKPKRVNRTAGMNPGVELRKQEALDRFREAVQAAVKNGHTEFNSEDLREAGLSQSQSLNGLQKLRELGEIRYVGTRPNPKPGAVKPFKTYTLVS